MVVLGGEVVSYERGTPVGGRRLWLPGMHLPYRGTSLVRKRNPLGPYRGPLPRVLGGSWKGGRFLMGEVPLHPKLEASLQRRCVRNARQHQTVTKKQE